jgi:methylase of polypeptide subunit release factors
MTAPAVAPLPRIGTDAEFGALRQALEAAGFTEETVRQRLSLKRISDFIRDGSRSGPVPEDSPGILIWLLMQGATISAQAAARIPLAELSALGLAMDHPSGFGVVSPAMVYPLRGVWVASDRPSLMDGQSSPPPDDFVFPAITPNTELFLDLTPLDSCDALLDLCAGSGAAALIGARCGARAAWSCDLTERSTHFAEFNRRLNGLERQVTVSCGDLYEAARGQTFDRIVAHPPYVAVYRHQFTFDSGGRDGEQIVRGTIAGLPRHLRPGGRFYSLTMGTDRRQPFEQRVRQWLGAASGEFDVALVTRSSRRPLDYTAEMAIREGGTAEEIRAWREALRDQGVEAFVYGFLAIQRRDGPRPVFTLRRKAGPETSRSEHTWLLDWETRLASEGAEVLLAARPRASTRARLETAHRLTAEGWAPESFRLEVEHPFDMEVRAGAWAAYLLAAADGERTGAQILEALKADGVLAAEVAPADFAGTLAMMVSGGFLAL